MELTFWPKMGHEVWENCDNSTNADESIYIKNYKKRKLKETMRETPGRVYGSKEELGQPTQMLRGRI